MIGWTQTSAAICVANQVSGGLGRAGLITIIVVSVITIIALVWIFRETGNRD